MGYKISKDGVQWGSNYTVDNGELRGIISEKYPILYGEETLIWSPLIGNSESFPTPFTGIIHPDGTELNIIITTEPETHITTMDVKIIQGQLSHDVEELGILIPDIITYDELKDWFTQ